MKWEPVHVIAAVLGTVFLTLGVTLYWADNRKPVTPGDRIEFAVPREPEVFIMLGTAGGSDPYRTLTDMGIEMIVILQESEGETCLFWARWKDGRELCVPSDPSDPSAAPPTGTLFLEPSGTGCGLWIWDEGKKRLLSEVGKPCPR